MFRLLLLIFLSRVASSSQSQSSSCEGTSYNASGTITSPNYPFGIRRPALDCYQYIYASGAYSVSIRIIDIDFYRPNNGACNYDYIQITGCDGSQHTICSSSSVSSTEPTFYCSSYSTNITIRFRAFPNVPGSRRYRGFKLSYSKQACGWSGGGRLIHGSTGNMTSPNYPRDFPSNIECSITLTTYPDNLRVQMTFESFSLGSSSCNYAFIKIICEDDLTVRGTFCGNSLPDRMTLSCTNVKIWFKSNSTNNYYTPRHFRLNYEAYSPSYYTSSPVYVQDSTADGRLGLILGAGVTGFLFVVLIILIIVITVSHRRQTARMEQRHLDDLTILTRCAHETRNGENWDGQTTVLSNGDHGEANTGFNYRSGLGHPETPPPSYTATMRRDAGDCPLIQFDDDEENVESPAPVPVSSLDQQIPDPVLSSEQPETNSEC